MRGKLSAVWICVFLQIFIFCTVFGKTAKNNLSEIYGSITNILLNDTTIDCLPDSLAKRAKNTRDSRGNTALHIACDSNNVAITEILLDIGISPDCKNSEGVRPIHISARNGNGTILSLLLKHGAFVNAKTKNDETALMFAAENNHSQFIDSLVAHRIRINSRDKQEMTALLYAVREGHNVIVKKLIGLGAGLKSISKDGKNIFHLAAFSGSIQTVKTLVAQPKQVMQTVVRHYGSGDYTFSGMYEPAANMPDINKPDDNGLSPLHYAIERGSITIVKLLIQYGADVNQETDSGETPIGLAIENSREDIVDILWACGGKR